MYGNLNQAVAGTHRLTSSNPNLQNLDNALKKVITARKEGFKIRGADYGKLEFCVAGMLGQDQQALNDILNKHDVHRYTAAVLELQRLDITKEEMKAISKEDRYEAKPHTFKPLYGGLSGTPEEQFYYKTFLDRYPGIKALQEKWVNEVLETQKLVTVTGLIFYFPGTRYTDTGYVINSTNIKNYPVQMFATADISQIGVAILWHNMKALNLKSFLLIEVHDSAIIEEANDESELIEQLCHRCMTKDILPFFKQVINYDINFPLEIETESHSHWDYDLPKEAT
jgi:DNA polymerase-1